MKEVASVTTSGGTERRKDAFIEQAAFKTSRRCRRRKIAPAVENRGEETGLGGRC